MKKVGCEGQRTEKVKIKLKRPHQNIQDKGEDGSPNPINHEDCHPL
jgi:hypothetical protein